MCLTDCPPFPSEVLKVRLTIINQLSENKSILKVDIFNSLLVLDLLIRRDCKSPASQVIACDSITQADKLPCDLFGPELSVCFRMLDFLGPSFVKFFILYLLMG